MIYCYCVMISEKYYAMYIDIVYKYCCLTQGPGVCKRGFCLEPYAHSVNEEINLLLLYFSLLIIFNINNLLELIFKLFNRLVFK